MRHAFLLASITFVLAGCPTRSNPDTGPVGMDVPRNDTPGGCAAGAEDSVAACTDGCDNDENGYSDCEDRDCCGLVTCGSTTYCGRQDAGPPVGGCDGGTSAEDNAAACADGCDNDGNGFADCNDFDCCSVVSCAAGTA